MSSNNEDVLRQFCDVTGADEDRSKFFLESSNWQLEVALSSFYENGGNFEDLQPAIPSQDVRPVTLSDSDMESPPASPIKPKKKDKNPKRTNTNFATLSSLQQDSSSDEEEVKLKELEQENVRLRAEVKTLQSNNRKLLEDIERKEKIYNNDTGQAFYAGGSERSGQQILGPGKGRKDIVTEMFKSVRERGAVAFEDEPSTAGGRGQAAFAGVGYRLGQTPDDHEQVALPKSQAQEDEVVSVRLRLYREGFSVDSGPLRPYTDPENTEFLNCIRRGEIPPELSLAGRGREVRVSLEDRRLEPAPTSGPRGRGGAFSGQGHVLGSPAPPLAPSAAPAPAAAAAAALAPAPAPAPAVRLDPALPTTTVQVRLADGTRVRGTFHPSHTVGDLRRFVQSASAAPMAPFVLMTTFPSTELSDPELTLEQAKLLNSVVVQRVK